MKKIVSAFMAFVLLTGIIAMPSDAQAAFSSVITNDEIDLFALLVDTDTVSINPLTVEVLFDLNDDPSFLIAEIIPQGYAIMFRNTRSISEKNTSDGVENPYRAASGVKYYAGPMTYIDFDNGIYTHIMSGTVLDNKAIQQLKEATEEAVGKLPQDDGSLFQPFALPIEKRILNQNFIRNAGYGENVDGTCGELAAALMLTYYEKLERSKGNLANVVVPSDLFPLDDTVNDFLHKKMIDLHNEFLGGSVPWTTASAINRYLKSDAKRRALMLYANWIIAYPTFYAKRSIDRNEPCIVFTNIFSPVSPNDTPADNYRKHAMVAYGYLVDGSNEYLITHTGWWNRNNSDDINDWTKRIDAYVNTSWFVGFSKIVKATAIVSVKKSIQLKKFVNMAKDKTKNIWTSSDPSIAKVDANGKITGVSAGLVSITHQNTDNGETTTMDVEVNIPIKKLKIAKLTKEEKKPLTIDTNGANAAALQLTATYEPADTTEIPLNWSSSDERVLKVDANGKVTAVGAGKATVTVIDASGKKKAKINLKVAYNPSSISLKDNNKNPLATVTLERNKSFKPKVEFSPDKKGGLDPNALKDLTWVSSDEAVAAVDAKGKVTAKAAGTATVSAAAKNGLTVSFQVIVPGVT